MVKVIALLILLLINLQESTIFFRMKATKISFLGFSDSNISAPFQRTRTCAELNIIFKLKIRFI